ncbi:UDP-N-acetylmuramoyl-tripeptide--D-alanyl-D-alanine ligase, partial [Patescibacteria group bacterium]|nr:UDP-N-acetylmuramoyl-tripeptide--D-alanyl-D-alanine ligase [Patescibacteria group bacterium]
MDILSLYQKFKECGQNISTDTRDIIAGSIFFAWKGELHDGNMFAADALEKGARYVVIDNPEYAQDERYILVENSIETLGHLARYHRQQFDIPVIGIAGSNGKTTTKELTARILSTQKNVVASFESENNHVGVPKTLLRINEMTEIVLVELGANHKGEIQHLCNIAQPNYGLITNIGRDHIGLFGDQTAIIEANIELYDYLKKSGGHILVNKHNMTLMKYGSGIDQTCYGEGIQTEFGIESLHSAPYVSFLWKQYTVRTHITGEYNIENIVAAIAIGVYFNIIDDNIIHAIESYVPNNNRSELIDTPHANVLIKDFYNANLTSMKFALQNLVDVGRVYHDKQTVAIMGDMLELGEYSLGEHQAAVDYAQELGIHRIVLIGTEFQKTHHGESVSYINVDEAIVELQQLPIKNSVIL